MNTAVALGVLRRIGQPFVTTAEAAAAFGQSPSAASRTLARLAQAGLIRRIRHGQWSLEPTPDPFAYASWLTTPLPSYVSLYSALAQHGLITQVPRVIYVASLARTQEITTSIGTFSVHQLQPALFTGFTIERGVAMATPEKAVFDSLYLARARSGRFAGLPEIELPSGFRLDLVAGFGERIEDPGARRRFLRRLRAFRGELEP
ncbi:MAG: MarR family transcriptional regulator [Chloroflexi bacterium]|nr:MarR family transcriptional regulator [Chloroflexota bacterium]